MSSVHFAPRAQRDLDEIAEYLTPRSPAAAIRFRAVVQDLTETLRNHPRLGSKIRLIPHVRSSLVAGFPYRLNYAVRGDDIVVLHICHTARLPWPEEQP